MGFNRGFGGWGGGYGLGYGLGGYGLGYGLGGYGLGYGLGGYGLGYGLGGYGLGYGLGGYGLGYGLGGYGYGGYYPGYYGIGYGYGGYYPGFYGCTGVTGSVYTLAAPSSGYVQPSYAAPSSPQMPRDDGTYPYDGGPTTPVPDPKATPAPTAEPQRTVPLEGRSVSLPRPATKWAYPAYGETARRTSFAEDRTLLTKNEPKRPPALIADRQSSIFRRPLAYQGAVLFPRMTTMSVAPPAGSTFRHPFPRTAGKNGSTCDNGSINERFPLHLATSPFGGGSHHANPASSVGCLCRAGVREH